VTFLGYQNFDALRDFVARARAFLFAGREDFGIVLVEAQAAGTPVIAFGSGGAPEIVRGLDAEQPTGVLFDEQTPRCVVAAVQTFEREEYRIRPADCRENALRFDVTRFQREFFDHASEQWRLFVGRSQRSRDAAVFASHPAHVVAEAAGKRFGDYGGTRAADPEIDVRR
jgi:glycosyltransferase involved in cell wall biosynthesis